MAGQSAQPPLVPADPYIPLLPVSRGMIKSETDKNSAEDVTDHAAFQPDATRTMINNATSGECHSFQHQPPHIAPTTKTCSPPPDFQHSVNVNYLPSMQDHNSQLSIIRTWMGAVPDMTAVRNRILTGSTSARRDVQLCQQQEEYFDSLLERLMKIVSKIQPCAGCSQTLDDFDSVSKGMRISHEKLRELRQVKRQSEDGILSQVHALKIIEEDVYRQIHGWTVDRLGQTPPASQPPFPIDQAPSNDEDIASNFRSALYSRMSDVRVLLDRTRIFEENLREALEERESLRALGHHDISDDVQFFEESREEREQIQADLEEAQDDVERLRRLCIEKGIEFYDVQFTYPHHPKAPIPDTISIPSTQAEAATLTLPESPSGILGSFFAKRELIQSWLKDPSNSDTPLTGTAHSDRTTKARNDSELEDDWVHAHRPRSWPRSERPSSALGAGDREAQPSMPEQVSGPPPGSKLMKALLKDSMDETGQITDEYGRISGNATI